MSTSDLECARQILDLTPRLMHWLACRLREQSEATSLTMPQFGALLYVQRCGGCSQSDVARWRDVAAPTMSRTVDALVEKGLLERRRLADDRRRVFLHLTAAGERFVAEVYAHMEQALAQELASGNPEQRAVIAAGLVELAALIKRQTAPGSSPRHSRPA
jgi:DNA-binding MarR family transcriptional regulator